MASLTTAMKICSTCGEEKSLDAFHRDKTKPDGRSPRCAACKSESASGYYERWTPEQRLLHRNRTLRYRYGITVEMIDALYEQQEGCCSLCCKPGGCPARVDKGTNRDTLHVDHDHESGKVRSLLCFDCNVGLGKFFDDPALLIRAASYLIEHGVSASPRRAEPSHL